MVFPILRMAAGLGMIVALTACVPVTGKLPSEHHAKADIDGPGIKGEAWLEQGYEGRVRIKMKVTGDATSKLTPGLHGVHIHETGDCGGTPPFSASKGHYDGNIEPTINPGADVTPGLENHPYHLGDLTNLEVDANRNGVLHMVTSRVTLTPGLTTVFDGDNSAFIIHEFEDKYLPPPPNPNGPGGPRIACGVIVKVP